MMKYNATTDSDSIVCVFPISGQYATLNRVLFYLLLATTVVVPLRKRVWLLIGAWAYIMTYSASTAIHAIVIVATKGRGFYNLDISGAWCILSASSLVSWPTALSSNRLRDSRYRPIFGIWGLLVSIGGFCCVGAFSATYPLEPACYSSAQTSNDTLLTDQSQLLLPGQYNCTYECFDKLYPTRQSSEITILTAERAFEPLSKLCEPSLYIAIALGLFWGFGMAVPDRRRTRAELIKTANQEVNYCVDVEVQTLQEDEINAARKELATGRYPHDFRVLAAISLTAFPVVVALNEVYINYGAPFPQSEEAYAVGQWAPWVSIGLTMVAAEINARYEPRWKELTKEWEEHDRVVREEQARKDQVKEMTEAQALEQQKAKIGDAEKCVTPVATAQGVLAPPEKAKMSLSVSTAELQRKQTVQLTKTSVNK